MEYIWIVKGYVALKIIDIYVTIARIFLRKTKKESTTKNPKQKSNHFKKLGDKSTLFF
jgi:hypothetical protein